MTSVDAQERKKNAKTHLSRNAIKLQVHVMHPVSADKSHSSTARVQRVLELLCLCSSEARVSRNREILHCRRMLLHNE